MGHKIICTECGQPWDNNDLCRQIQTLEAALDEMTAKCEDAIEAAKWMWSHPHTNMAMGNSLLARWPWLGE